MTPPARPRQNTLNRDPPSSDDDRNAYLLERLAVGRLGRRAKQLLAEGWKWVDILQSFADDEDDAARNRSLLALEPEAEAERL